MAIKTAGALLFHTMERDDVNFCEKLQDHGYRTFMIGTNPGVTTYPFTPRRVGEKITKTSQITLTEAIDMEGFDVLVIPGGLGAGRVENVVGVRQLVEKAKKIVTFSYGVTLLANTGVLNGKNATTDDHFFYGVGLAPWEDVNWQRDPEFVIDGKFITAKYAEHALVLPEILPEGATPAPELAPEPIPHLIDQLPAGELTPWQALVKRLRDHAKRLGEESDVPIDSKVLASHPFLRAPADPAAISTTETNLGIQLPQDYKDFFQVTNGTGFSGISSIPGLAPVEDLAWQSTEVSETGLDDLAELMDIPGMEEVTPQERTLFPALQRVIIISDPDDEEIVGMYDPAYIQRATRTIREIRGLPLEEPATDEWIVFLFIPYAASYDQFGSFEEYIESRLDA